MAHARHAEHKHSAVPYVAVWIALLVLTAVTYITGTQHLGRWALPLALFIALLKSSLVALIFMHLKDSGGATRAVLALAMVFVATLLFFTIADVATRYQLATPAGAPFGTERAEPGAEQKAPEAE